MDPHETIEQTVRDSYGKLLAFLVARSGDFAAAEDGLADAVLSAIKTWPATGVPTMPEAWLLTAARRRMIDAARRIRVQADALPALLAAAEEAQSLFNTDVSFPDERLKLLFICAHPAVAEEVRTPLILQVVLGLDAANIASAFLVRPSTMGRRLNRAKTKIRDAKIPFDIPDATDLPPRVAAVLEAIYAAYGSGWEDVAGVDPRRKGLTMEAIFLCRLVVGLLPSDPEARGLLALMLHCEARRDARRSNTGAYVPLLEQEVGLWSRPMIEEADRLLLGAAECRCIGRFQLQAAIQSVHAQRAVTGGTNWEEIAVLYEGLVRLAPTVGALIGRAAAVAEARDAETGWALLQQLPESAVTTYQPYWVLVAHLLRRLGRFEASAAALERAIGLSEEPAIRDFLAHKAAEVNARKALG